MLLSSLEKIRSLAGIFPLQGSTSIKTCGIGHPGQTHISIARVQQHMDQYFLSTALKYYKRPEIQEAIVRHAADREVSPQYGAGFGKRPDVLEHPKDVIAFATRKATSFHCSEERWEQPMRIQTGMNRKEADELRIGWDLVLDIDAKDWEISRLTARLFVLALRAHGIESVTCKFSGNKGWHIGVPYEAFPSSVTNGNGDEIPMSTLFPDMPKAIATYLVDYIGDPTNELVEINEDTVSFHLGTEEKKLILKKKFANLAKQAGKERHDVLELYCPACHKTVEREAEQHTLICAQCGHRSERYSAEQKAGILDEERVCPKCKHVMDFHLLTKRTCPHNTDRYRQRFKITAVIEFDTILLASRHLFRMPYSLHEKSGLASVVIDPDTLLTFKKTSAKPEVVDVSKTFLDVENTVLGEAGGLVQVAWERYNETATPRYETKEYDVPDELIEEKHFPPCMIKILGGLEDGKKRAMFALVNFLQTAGWPPEMVDKKIHEWNERNPEPLREVHVKGHLRQHLQKKMKILPPNCMQFYQELGVCNPDDLCRRVKNPAQYALKKSKMK